MGLHIEIGPDMDRKEWLGVKALAMIMLGETFLATPEGIAVGIPTGAPMPENTAPTPPQLEPGTAPIVATEAPAPPVAPAPPINPAAIPPSESLMAAAATAAAAAVAAGAELDVTGLPWDARIHAGTKTKKADGSWTAKRGADPALIAAVTEELRAIMAAPTIAAAPLPPGSEAPPPPVATDPAVAFGSGAPPAPEPTPETTAEAPAAASENIMEFARIMRVVVEKQTSGGLTTATVNEIVKQLGLTDVRDLAKRPDLIPGFEALLP